MKEVKTAELTGAALDWAVAKCNMAYHTQVLIDHGYWVGERDFGVRPGHTGAFMVTDRDDVDGYAIVGDDLDELVIEAHDTLFDAVEYSTDWSQGGPLIDSVGGFELKIWLESSPDTKCEAHIHDYEGDWIAFGPTPLVASMRCLVTRKLGDTVDVPEELLP